MHRIYHDKSYLTKEMVKEKQVMKDGRCILERNLSLLDLFSSRFLSIIITEISGKAKVYCLKTVVLRLLTSSAVRCSKLLSFCFFSKRAFCALWWPTAKWTWIFGFSITTPMNLMQSFTTGNHWVIHWITCDCVSWIYEKGFMKRLFYVLAKRTD